MTPALWHALAVALVPLVPSLVVAVIALIRAEAARVAAGKAAAVAQAHAQLPPEAAHPAVLRRAVPLGENDPAP